MQQTLRITSFRGPPPEYRPEIKRLSTAMLAGPAPPSGTLVDVTDDILFAYNKRGNLDARLLCHASLAMAVDDMTAIIQSAACKHEDVWVSEDQARRHSGRASVAYLTPRPPVAKMLLMSM